jgi:DNA polymerase II large subunit
MIEPVILPATAPRSATAYDALNSYPQEFYFKANERHLSKELAKGARNESNMILAAPEWQSDFTHWSSVIVASQSRSGYAVPGPMPDKVGKQIAIAKKIRAVDVDSLVSSLLNNYLVKEIMDNLDAYSTQSFRCKGCGEVYRRPPLRGACLTCGRELLPTVTLAAVEKYVLLANELTRSHHIAQPIRDKVALTLENLLLLSESKKQTSIADFV